MIFSRHPKNEKGCCEKKSRSNKEVGDEPTAVETTRPPGRAPCPTTKEQRTQAPQELLQGFHVCTARRRKIKRLHLLHKCWMVQGVDYFAYINAGKSMPPQADFDEVCKMCADRKEEHQPNNASDSESNPSTDDIP